MRIQGKKTKLHYLSKCCTKDGLVRCKCTSHWLPGSSWWTLPLESRLQKAATQGIRAASGASFIAVVPRWSKFCQHLLWSENGALSWRWVFTAKSLCSLNILVIFSFLIFHEVTENAKIFSGNWNKNLLIGKFCPEWSNFLHWKYSSCRI